MRYAATLTAGALNTSGLGSNAAGKEAVKVGFDYFKAHATHVSASAKARDHDFHLHFVELHNTGPSDAATLASFVALCSGILAKPIQAQMVILGSMSLGGSIIPVENLAETLQVAFDAGAKRILRRRRVCGISRRSQGNCLPSSRRRSTRIRRTQCSRRWECNDLTPTRRPPNVYVFLDSPPTVAHRCPSLGL